MATWRKLQLTLSQIIHALRETITEILEYFFNPFVFIIILRRIAKMNLNIRNIWRTKRRGRPPISDMICRLIIELKELNPSWGGKRISDELKRIGYKICKESVLKILRSVGLINTPPHRGLSLSEFLGTHGFKIGIDFTCIFDLFGRQYFILVILDLENRTLLHINATLYPDRQWITQQFRNSFFDLEIYPTLCISDRDAIYGKWLKEMLRNYYGTKLIRIPYRQPWKNGRVGYLSFGWSEN